MNLHLIHHVARMTAIEILNGGEPAINDPWAIELSSNDQGQIVMSDGRDGYQTATIEHEPVDSALCECEILALLEAE
jgi:hypothetical protein